ncbi:MAG: DNA polymerase III subunit gamma/tau [Ruminococcaceae bacterium]|nr:DNA polymerase III subunit gamma/tau [Oscillospiraceae bacterium]
MYQALYRKWRPQTFSDVCGQETVTTALKNELKNDRLSHAYLFTGCRGTGKTTCAKILAKAVNCLHPVEGDPCNECAICRGIDDGSVLDVTEIDAASNNGVDNIRDLREEVSFTPVNGRYRVYIIDEVHMLSSGAFNALLKTLEEPPAHVIFILATTEVHKLPATILSRCQRFDFGRIRPETIADRLHQVAKAEGLTLTDEAAALLSRLADGAMRDALSLLDQCASGNSHIDAAVVAACTGMTGVQSLHDLTVCAHRQDAAGALGLLEELYRSSKDMERLCAEWIGYLRNLMILQNVREPGELIVAPPEDMAPMRELAGQMPPATVLHMLSVLQDALERLKGGVSRRVEMEMTLLRLCDPRLEDSTPALLRRIGELEQAVRSGVTVAPSAPAEPAPAQEPVTPAQAPAVAAEPAPVQEPPAPAEPPEAPEETPCTQWGDVLDKVMEQSMPLFAVLADSTALYKGDMLLICTDNEMFKEMLSRDNNKELLMTAIQAVTGSRWRLGLRRISRVQKGENDPLSRLLDAGRQAGIPVSENE